MKKLWARVGMEIEVSDNLYNTLVDSMNNHPTRKRTKQLLKALIEERGKLSGETYFPGFEDVNEDLEFDYYFDA